MLLFVVAVYVGFRLLSRLVCVVCLSLVFAVRCLLLLVCVVVVCCCCLLAVFVVVVCDLLFDVRCGLRLVFAGVGVYCVLYVVCVLLLLCVCVLLVLFVYGCL